MDSYVTCKNQMPLGMGLHVTLFQTAEAARDFREAGPGNEEVTDD